jgi:hypothetical protein
MTQRQYCFEIHEWILDTILKESLYAIFKDIVNIGYNDLVSFE